MISKTVKEIRERVIFNSKIILKGINSDEDRINIINSLKEILDTVKEMQYDNCSIDDYEALIDEEVVLDILLNKGMLDIETAKEIAENDELYVQGEFTPKKVLEGIL